MRLSAAGKIVEKHLYKASNIVDSIDLLLFVVMPNHIHMIVRVEPICCDLEAGPNEQRNPNPSLRPNSSISRYVPKLTRFIRSFKASVTIEARRVNREFGWQGRFHDHLIRGRKDMNKIADYIVNNVARWESDCFNEKSETKDIQ